MDKWCLAFSFLYMYLLNLYIMMNIPNHRGHQINSLYTKHSLLFIVSMLINDNHFKIYSLACVHLGINPLSFSFIKFYTFSTTHLGIASQQWLFTKLAYSLPRTKITCINEPSSYLFLVPALGLLYVLYPLY